jgi:lipoprotein-releasing system permease protein
MQKTIDRNPIIRIAVRHLLSKKKQTLVAVLGVTFGIAAFIFQAGIITGIQSFFKDRTIELSAHIHLFKANQTVKESILERSYSQDDTTKMKQWLVVNNQKNLEESPRIRNGYQIIKALEEDEDVLGATPFLGLQIIIRAGLTQTGARAAGIDVDRENFLFNVQKYMKSGDINQLKTISNGIVLGAGLADNLGAKLNDFVVVSSPKGVTLEMKVVGINRTGITSLDDTRAYITISNAQKLLLADGAYITDINIKIKDLERAAELAEVYQRRYNYKAEDWIKANEGIFTIFKLQNMAIYMVITSIMLVAGFGIFNILTMIIYEKMPDIAILKAVGYTDGDIKAIFLTESVFIGFCGGILGLLLGFGLSKLISNIPVNVNKGILAFEYLMINFNPWFYVTAFVLGLLVTALAGYFPAKKASQVDPITIIRGK